MFENATRLGWIQIAGLAEKGVGLLGRSRLSAHLVRDRLRRPVQAIWLEDAFAVKALDNLAGLGR
ncbi:MAG: hypothetical protein ACREOS_06240, partial [Candidatus Dormibacteraceae bacterium]